MAQEPLFANAKILDKVEVIQALSAISLVYEDIEDNNNIAIIYKRFEDTLGSIRCH